MEKDIIKFNDDVSYYSRNKIKLQDEIRECVNEIIALETTMEKNKEIGAEDNESDNLIEDKVAKLKERATYLKEIRETIRMEEETKYKVKMSEKDKELLQKIHDIEDNQEENVDEQDNEDRMIILSEWSTVKSLMKNGINKTYSLREYFLNHYFLVKLPDIFNIRPSEIVSFDYTIPQGKKIGLFKKRGEISVIFRETIGYGQISSIYKNLGRNIYDKIRLIKIDKDGKHQYTIVFSGLKLTNFYDGNYAYENETEHEIIMHLTYKNIEYVDAVNVSGHKVYETTTEEKHSNKTDKKEDDTKKE